MWSRSMTPDQDVLRRLLKRAGGFTTRRSLASALTVNERTTAGHSGQVSMAWCTVVRWTLRSCLRCAPCAWAWSVFRAGQPPATGSCAFASREAGARDAYHGLHERGDRTPALSRREHRKSHLSSAYMKLGVRSRKDAAALILDPHEGFGAGILSISHAQRPGRVRSDDVGPQNGRGCDALHL